MKSERNNLHWLTNIVSVAGGVTVSRHAYQYNSADQPTRRTLADNSYWVYSYDNLGQVTSGRRYWSDGTPVAGQQFDYSFDDIGNRKTAAAGGDQWGANLRYQNYTANNLNEYSQRSVPDYLNVLGTATNTTTVTVNNQPTYRKGTYFRAELAVTNTAAPVWLAVTNLAVLNDGTNADIIASVTGSVLVAKSPEPFTYDADGILTSDITTNVLGHIVSLFRDQPPPPPAKAPPSVGCSLCPVNGPPPITIIYHP